MNPNQRQPHTFEFSREYWITRQFVSIPGHIINYIKNATKSTDSHITKYFMRAFTRWMFNIIRNGKNPFCEIVTSRDLIIEKDLEYFFHTRDIFTGRGSKRLSVFDWTWLDQKLRNIQCSFDPTMKVKQINVRVEVDEVSSDDLGGRGGNTTALDGRPKQFVFFDIEDTTFKISKRQYKLALSRFRGDTVAKSLHKDSPSIPTTPEMFNEYLAILIARYICIGTTNNHCSVPPHVIDYCGIKTELFGSPLNTSVEQYCSPMIDIERHFGSLGSFFEFDMGSGTYLLNPPYDESIINEAMEKIFKVLATSKEVTVIVVLPIWDIETQIAFDQGNIKGEGGGGRSGGVSSSSSPSSTSSTPSNPTFKKSSKNVEFPIIPIIKGNKHTRSHYLLRCHTHKFFNFYIDGYLPMADTHLFVMSNTVYNLTAHQIARVWEFGLNDGRKSMSSSSGSKRNSW